jgi:hypothetical protein
MLAGSVLLLAAAVVTAAPARATDLDAHALQERAWSVFDHAVRQLASSPAELQTAAPVLMPLPGLHRIAAAALSIPRDAMDPQEAAAAIVDAAGLDCNQLLYYAAVALFIDVVIDGRVLNIPYIGFIADLLVAVTILCYLGVL